MPNFLGLDDYVNDHLEHVSDVNVNSFPINIVEEESN